MRGDKRVQGMMFATVALEDRVPADHPLRAIRRLIDPILRDLSTQFEALYSQVAQLEYNLLYRWFVGLDLKASAWHAMTFTKNRQCLLDKGYDTRDIVEGASAAGFTRNVRYRGAARGDWIVTFACAAYTLVRLRRLIPA